MEFTSFYKDVVSHLPGAPLPAVDYALLQAAIEYCDGSLCLQYDTEPISVRAGVSNYEIPLADEETMVAMIVSAKYNGRPIYPMAVDLRPWQMREAQTYELENEPVEIKLIDTPTVAGTLLLRIAVRPLQDATMLPDELYHRHRKGICAGALSRMMLQAGKTWSQPQLGLLRANEFRAEINSAQVDANRTQTRAELRVRPRPLA